MNISTLPPERHAPRLLSLPRQVGSMVVSLVLQTRMEDGENGVLMLTYRESRG